MNYAKQYERWKSLTAQQADLDRQVNALKKELFTKAKKVFLAEFPRMADAELSFAVGNQGVNVRAQRRTIWGDEGEPEGGDKEELFVPARYLEVEDPLALKRQERMEAAEQSEYQHFLRLKKKYESPDGTPLPPV